MGNTRRIRKAVLKALLIPLSFSVVCSCSSSYSKLSSHSKKTNVAYECNLTYKGEYGHLHGYKVKFVLGKHPRAYTTRYYAEFNPRKSLAKCQYVDDANGKKWLVCLTDRTIDYPNITNEYVILQPDEDKAYWADGYNAVGICSGNKVLNLGITNDEELCGYAVDNHCKKITQ